MRETINTRQFNVVPEARYRMTVAGKPEKFKAGKTSYRRWIFKCEVSEGRLKDLRVNLFPWESHDLLIALGGTDLGNDDVDWDDDRVEGKIIKADLKHESYKKSDGTTGTSYKLENVEEALPF